ncbi:hypothetical protein [Planococcus salinarum]|uniref:hypothetical protein n=1 Tax=Planococcus salinarum TaxID=622695 RepID=UPI000E3CB760|nr:hypothetical protein [Planococcus salinarum]TAA72593.1 hypothetical protein D2909_05325 [Planococcus salinarum]
MTDQRSGLGRAAGLPYDPKSWAAGVWTTKSASARLTLKGKRWTKCNLGHLFATKLAQRCRSNKGLDDLAKRRLFSRIAKVAYDPKSWAVGV